MGTSGLGVIRYRSRQGRQVMIPLYFQCDGYPSGQGLELAKAANKQIVNGYSLGMTMETHANGVSCLALSIIAALKDRIGGVYLTALADRDGITAKDVEDWGYVYEVALEEKETESVLLRYAEKVQDGKPYWSAWMTPAQAIRRWSGEDDAKEELAGINSVADRI